VQVDVVIQIQLLQVLQGTYFGWDVLNVVFTATQENKIVEVTVNEP